uniref:uncharacterized protein LOC122591498 n=1 Tax=Erigeron canadensis TaxID=72917 RepID=UPI001CB8D406|nr:uncharacterized protein LOC122591498 [Erigeron canadensis]
MAKYCSATPTNPPRNNPPPVNRNPPTRNTRLPLPPAAPVQRNQNQNAQVQLQEGSLFSFKGFKVHCNRDTFRIFKDALYMLEFEGNTKVAKATGYISHYIRYLFQFLELEEVVPTENLYVVDLIGYLTSVGEILTKSTGAKTLEFNFTNQRGWQVRVTLWGKLGNNMIKKKLQNPVVYALILTAMSAKKYFGKIVTLFIIVRLGRMKKSDPGNNEDETVVFSNMAEIVGVRTSSRWYLITCSSGRCLKGLTRDDGGFKCEGCNKIVAYPRFRFKLQLDIRDETATVVAVLFDNAAETLLNRSAKSLMEEEMRDDLGDDVLPPALQQLLGTKHRFEIKGHSYYCAGTYEAFNCNQVILPGTDPLLLGADSSQHTASKATMGSSSVKVKDPIPVVTPLKTREPRKCKLHTKESDRVLPTVGKNKAVLNLGTVGDKNR